MFQNDNSLKSNKYEEAKDDGKDKFLKLHKKKIPVQKVLVNTNSWNSNIYKEARKNRQIQIPEIAINTKKPEKLVNTNAWNS